MSQTDRTDDNELIVFEPEPEPELRTSNYPEWKILIVDDDEQTHLVTKLALSDVRILKRDLNLIHAYNADEAYSILKETSDIAVIVLDVVMETDSAGLDLVRRIREDLNLHTTRIVIRTGQPGYAPELKVIEDYDINDYKMKSELTRNRLISTLTTTIRSYEQYKAIAQHTRGMEEMIDGSQSLFSFSSIEDYSTHVIDRLSSILNSDCEALLCSQHLSVSGMSEENEYFIIAASTSYSEYIDSPIDKLDSDIYKNILRVFEEKNSFFEDNYAFIYLYNDNKHNGALLLKSDHILNAAEQQLLKVYSVQVSVGFGNQYLLNQLHLFAYFDQLCQLPNRTRFLQEISRRQQTETNLTVAIIDVDQFSEINNAMGYQNGDLLLQSIARRLVIHLHNDILLARISGDTFGILGPENQIDPATLIGIFKEPFVINGTSFPIKSTVGLAKLDPRDINNEEVLKNADLAMKIAKNSAGKKKFQYYNNNMEKAMRNRIAITNDLRKAIEKDELVLFFQPQLNLVTGELKGVESLIRWQKEDGELIPPSSFIPIAEQSGLIIDIGEIAIRKAMEFMQNWIDSGKEPFRVGINVSVRQFHSERFSRYLSDIVSEFTVDPRFLELEITESMLMHDVDEVVKILNGAKKLGISIAIDDFGTGFSSLSYLLLLPIDRLKIDRSFIINLEHDVKAQRLTQLIIRMGKQLQLELIAEGVETEKQVEFLRNLECDEVQGFLYSKPLSTIDFYKWMETVEISL